MKVRQLFIVKAPKGFTLIAQTSTETFLRKEGLTWTELILLLDDFAFVDWDEANDL